MKSLVILRLGVKVNVRPDHGATQLWLHLDPDVHCGKHTHSCQATLPLRKQTGIAVSAARAGALTEVGLPAVLNVIQVEEKGKLPWALAQEGLVIDEVVVLLVLLANFIVEELVVLHVGLGPGHDLLDHLVDFAHDGVSEAAVEAPRVGTSPRVVDGPLELSVDHFASRGASLQALLDGQLNHQLRLIFSEEVVNHDDQRVAIRVFRQNLHKSTIYISTPSFASHTENVSSDAYSWAHFFWRGIHLWLNLPSVHLRCVRRPHQNLPGARGQLTTSFGKLQPLGHQADPRMVPEREALETLWKAPRRSGMRVGRPRSATSPAMEAPLGYSRSAAEG